MLLVKFDIGSHTTIQNGSIGSHTAIQNVSICDKVNRVYLSKAGCKETHIVLLCFPHFMPSLPDIIPAVNNVHVESPTKPKFTLTRPPKPQTLPYPATEANVPKLEQYIKDAFKDTAFNRSPPFPAMSGPQAHIHLKPDALPIHTTYSNSYPIQLERINQG